MTEVSVDWPYVSCCFLLSAPIHRFAGGLWRYVSNTHRSGQSIKVRRCLSSSTSKERLIVFIYITSKCIFTKYRWYNIWNWWWVFRWNAHQQDGRTCIFSCAIIRRFMAIRVGLTRAGRSSSCSRAHGSKVSASVRPQTSTCSFVCI